MSSNQEDQKQPDGSVKEEESYSDDTANEIEQKEYESAVQMQQKGAADPLSEEGITPHYI